MIFATPALQRHREIPDNPIGARNTKPLKQLVLWRRYLRGNKKAAFRVDHIYPESVAAIRAKLHLSQTEFSTSAPPRFETGNKAEPTGAARVLLRVAAKNPKAVLEAER
jgi:putative transcriptional regulator